MSENDIAKIARLVAFPGSPDDMMNTIAELRARVAKLEAALTMMRDYGCPVCHGDCASANPPMGFCPMLEVRAALKDAPQ